MYAGGCCGIILSSSPVLCSRPSQSFPRASHSRQSSSTAGYTSRSHTKPHSSIMLPHQSLPLSPKSPKPQTTHITQQGIMQQLQSSPHQHGLITGGFTRPVLVMLVPEDVLEAMEPLPLVVRAQDAPVFVADVLVVLAVGVGMVAV